MRQLLSQGVPFVVNDIQMRGTYDPNYFMNKYYGEPCKIHHVDTGEVQETTVDQFFRTFGNLRPLDARAKLKASCVALSWVSLPNSPAGLAAGGSFSDQLWGTIRGFYRRRSFPGHHDSQWRSQSGGTLSNERCSPGLGYVDLALTVLRC